MRNATLAALLPAALLMGAAAAQNGNNSCGSATPINGLGTFLFDNNGATIDGPADCNGAPVRRDIWYLWTAPATDGYEVTTCGGTTLETRIAVYDGFDCVNYPQIGCAASTCQGQSSVAFNAVGGQQYLIRLGSRTVGSSGSGTFDILTNFCVTNPQDQFDPNGDCSMAATLTNGSYTGLFVSKDEPDYYQFEVPAGGALQMDWFFSHSSGDIDIFVYDDCGNNVIAESLSGSNDETIFWTNPDPCDKLISVRTEIWTGSNLACNTYDMVVSGIGSTGNPCSGGGGSVAYGCDPANPNSTGLDAKISASGSLSSTDAFPVHLDVTQGPASQFAYFVTSATLNDPGVNVASGRLCVGAPLARFSPGTATAASNPQLNSLGQFDSAGVLQSLSGNSATGAGFDVPQIIPDPINGTIAPGSTWVFQLWYRDGPTSNFSTAAVVTFS